MLLLDPRMVENISRRRSFLFRFEQFSKQILQTIADLKLVQGNWELHGENTFPDFTISWSFKGKLRRYHGIEHDPKGPQIQFFCVGPFQAFWRHVQNLSIRSILRFPWLYFLLYWKAVFWGCLSISRPDRSQSASRPESWSSKRQSFKVLHLDAWYSDYGSSWLPPIPAWRSIGLTVHWDAPSKVWSRGLLPRGSFLSSILLCDEIKGVFVLEDRV